MGRRRHRPAPWGAVVTPSRATIHHAHARGAIAVAAMAVASAIDRLAADHDAAHAAGDWLTVDRAADALVRLGLVGRDLRDIAGGIG